MRLQAINGAEQQRLQAVAINTRRRNFGFASSELLTRLARRKRLSFGAVRQLGLLSIQPGQRGSLLFAE
ncbi:MAG: hypothetical protein BWZ07_02206 [Alphaproteobacteria bacterium ADurb.BinA280]|nr:MAG: hypothetical protein BWZ07_02206 [Alphaproteobacteria bacterium ADurb.BinA280]